MTSLLASIVPLAMLDAVSVGALAMPVWFLISDRVRHGYVCLYLAILAVAYAALGLGLLGVLGGSSGLRDGVDQLVDSVTGDWIRGVLGVALLVFAAWYGLVHKAVVRGPGAGRLSTWRRLAVGEHARIRVTIGLALVATVVEIPTAVPYAIALGRIDESGVGALSHVGAVGVYAAAMVSPALVLTAGSAMARGRVEGLLHRVEIWFRVNAQENTAWVVAIVGLALFFETTLYDSVMDLVSDTAATGGGG